MAKDEDATAALGSPEVAGTFAALGGRVGS